MAELHGERPMTAECRDHRSAMARTSDALPFRPYVYRGNPPARRAASGRQDGWLSAGRTGRFAAGAGTGRDPLTAHERNQPATPEPASAPPVARCPSCGYLVTAPGHAIECGGDDARPEVTR